MLKFFGFEGSVVVYEFHQIQRSQIAGGVIHVHIFGAGVRGIYAAGIRTGVPVINSGIELHSRIPAFPCGLGNFLKQVFGIQLFGRLAVNSEFCFPGFIFGGGFHKIIADANGIICVLELNGIPGRIV